MKEYEKNIKQAISTEWGSCGSLSELYCSCQWSISLWSPDVLLPQILLWTHVWFPLYFLHIWINESRRLNNKFWSIPQVTCIRTKCLIKCHNRQLYSSFLERHQALRMLAVVYIFYLNTISREYFFTENNPSHLGCKQLFFIQQLHPEEGFLKDTFGIFSAMLRRSWPKVIIKKIKVLSAEAITPPYSITTFHFFYSSSAVLLYSWNPI